MKKAEEWMSQMSGLNNPALLTVNRMAIREIQLDALKEGARRAARHVHGVHIRSTTPEMVEFNSGVKQTKDKVEQAILTAAEQLTRKDL